MAVSGQNNVIIYLSEAVILKPCYLMHNSLCLNRDTSLTVLLQFFRLSSEKRKKKSKINKWNETKHWLKNVVSEVRSGTPSRCSTSFASDKRSVCPSPVKMTDSSSSSSGQQRLSAVLPSAPPLPSKDGDKVELLVNVRVTLTQPWYVDRETNK